MDAGATGRGVAWDVVDIAAQWLVMNSKNVIFRLPATQTYARKAQLYGIIRPFDVTASDISILYVANDNTTKYVGNTVEANFLSQKINTLLCGPDFAIRQRGRGERP